MRITKKLAEDVAVSLLQKKKEEIKNLRNELSEYAYDLAASTIPDEVKEFDKKFPEYVSKETHISFSEKWFEYQWKNFYFPEGKSLPLKSEYLEVEREVLKQIEAKQDHISKLENEYRQARREVENAIFNLRTVANVKKELPEAIPFLPEPGQTTALTVRIDKVRELLK